MLCAALLLTATNASFAGGEQTLERVVVVANVNDALGYAETASEGTVTAQQLEHRPLSRPGDVLETIPGMIVTQHSGTGKANQFFLRGFNLDHGTDFRTSFAGVPVNLPSHGHGQGYTDINFLIPELISKVQYKKGTYFAEEGDFSAAGAANIDYVNQLDNALV
jgi:outer membrane cobalamin receptor